MREQLASFYSRHFKKLPQQSRSRAIVNALLVSTLEAFNRGSENMILSEVARRAGVGIGSLYDYFGGEGDILAGALGKLTEDNLLSLEEVLRSTEAMPLPTMIRVVVGNVLDTYLKDKRLPRAALRVAYQLKLMPMLAEGQSMFATALAQALARRPEVTVKDVDSAAYAISHGVMGLIVSSLWDDEAPGTPDEVLDTIVDMVAAYLQGDGVVEPLAPSPCVTPEPELTPIERDPTQGRLFSMYETYFKKVPKQARSQDAVAQILKEARRVMSEAAGDFSVANMQPRPGLKIASVYDYFRTRADLEATTVGLAAEHHLESFEAMLSEADTGRLETVISRAVNLAFVTYVHNALFARAAYTVAHRMGLMPILLRGRALAMAKFAEKMRSRSDVQKDKLELACYVAAHLVMGVVHTRVWERTPLVSEARVHAACVSLVVAALRS
jgi:AcrR family transcriptional regulator